LGIWKGNRITLEIADKNNMACIHKFESYLNLERLDFEPITLIVGTFNPSMATGNDAEWFYGRTKNNYFWDILPRLYGEPTLLDDSVIQWKRFCCSKKIAITDIIRSIDDANPVNDVDGKYVKGFSDDQIANDFYDFDLVNIVRLLRNHPTITNVYVTRSMSATFWSNKLYPVKRYCESNRIGLKSLLTPSRLAFREWAKFKNGNPENNKLPMEDFILMRWKDVLNKTET
jgi:hypothetical protein